MTTAPQDQTEQDQPEQDQQAQQAPDPAPSVLPDKRPLRAALDCVCPRCLQGPLYKAGFITTTVVDECAVCGLPLRNQDSADAPAVLLMFFLGALLVPLALALESALQPPLWVHAVLWGGVAVGLTLFSLRHMKAYVIALQFKHRPEDIEERPAKTAAAQNEQPNGDQQNEH